MKIGHWTYHTIIDYQDYFGFTYKITCSVNNKWYIGSKFFRVKCGQKGKYRKEDWLDYTGSSKTLNADITKYGKDKFTFTILALHTTRRELHYEEARTIMVSNALLDINSYNEWVNLKCRYKK